MEISVRTRKNTKVWLPLIATLVLPLVGHATTITQTVNSASSSSDWNTALWGSGPDVPTSGNDYVTAAGLGSSGTTRIGSPDVSGRVRDYTGSTFLGDSLTIVANTEFLLKQTANQTSTANIILDGGIIRLSAGNSAQGTVTGNVYVASESWIGVADLGTPVLTVGSTITGTNVLHVASGLGTTGSGTVRFTGDISGFNGTLELGGGDVGGTLEFGQAYNATNTTLSLRNPSADLINLTTNTPQERTFNPPGSAQFILTIVGTVCVIPLAVIGAGVYAWVMRRRRG